MVFRSPFYVPVIASCPSRRIDSCGFWATMLDYGGRKLNELRHLRGPPVSARRITLMTPRTPHRRLLRRTELIHEVTLYREKGNKAPVALSYGEETLRRSQTRLINRTTLTPEIDLKAYRCRALVDWIDIHFELSRRTQYWHLNDRIEKLTGRKEYPEALILATARQLPDTSCASRSQILRPSGKCSATLRALMASLRQPASVGLKSASTSTPKSRARKLERECTVFWSGISTQRRRS